MSRASSGRAPSPKGRGAAWPVELTIAHGLMALCAIGAAGLALFLVNPPDWSDAYVRRYVAGIEFHKVLGLAALVGAVWLAARHGRRPARTGSERERIAAAVVQTVLLALVVLTATCGYLSTAFYGQPLALPGLPPLPSPVARNTGIGGLFSTLHDLCAFSLLGLIGLHVAVAFHRQFFTSDPVIARILRLDRNAEKDDRP